ncbi:MAG: hypothetical protein JRI86_15035 [Deltaproteobacteria bacterium]|nr:hypothetical protein [Deltaproteobacteria bacterium]
MAQKKQTLFQKIPGVDRLLLSPGITEVSATQPRNLLLKAINLVLEEIRTRIQAGDIIKEDPDLSLETLSNLVVKRLESISQPSLKAVINATGVVIHTNMGRSILPEKVLKKFRPLAGGYSNLEYDLDKGER